MKSTKFRPNFPSFDALLKEFRFLKGTSTISQIWALIFAQILKYIGKGTTYKCSYWNYNQNTLYNFYGSHFEKDLSSPLTPFKRGVATKSFCMNYSITYLSWYWVLVLNQLFIQIQKIFWHFIVRNPAVIESDGILKCFSRSSKAIQLK